MNKIKLVWVKTIYEKIFKMNGKMKEITVNNAKYPKTPNKY